MANYVVAGGTSGIGAACTVALATSENLVVAIGRGEEHAQELRSKVANAQGSVHVLQGDLVDRAFANTILDALDGAPVDGVVNCAGTITGQGILAETPEQFESVVSTNLVTAFNVVQVSLEALGRAENPAIVNISSVCSLRPCTSLSYSVSKAGMDMFTKCLAKDLAPQGIRVNSVNPGVVASNLQMSAGLFSSDSEYREWLEAMAVNHPLGRVGTPEDVAEAVLFLLSAKSAWTTGAVLSIDGGRAIA